MAGIKLEIMKPSDEAPEGGMLEIQVELTPMCSSDARPGTIVGVLLLPAACSHIIDEEDGFQ